MSLDKDDVAISVKGLYKSFSLPHEKNNSIKGSLLNKFKGGRKTYEKQQVLKDINFEIKKGEFFGIVGRNGSGKSTLLKLLAGIYAPDKGNITVNGKLTPFIELGVGFNPELTGRENVFLNGALLGFTRQEMLSMYNEIVEFAELERFMDQKLKNYSSGMQVRLAFSIAIRANTDILVLDEVLAVGDYNFQQKCFEYFRYLKKSKKTVVLVSHDSNALQMFCNNGVLIENGEIKKRGNIGSVLKIYAKQNQDDEEETLKHNKKKQKTEEQGNGKVKLKSIIMTNQHHKTTISFAPNDIINLELEFAFEERVEYPVFGIIFQDSEGGQPIFATNTMDGNKKTRVIGKGEHATIKFSVKNTFNDGRYYISGAVASSDRSTLFLRYINAGIFASVGWQMTAKSRVYHDYIFSIDPPRKEL